MMYFNNITRHFRATRWLPVNYSEAMICNREPRFLEFDLPKMGSETKIFLQIDVGDFLESQAVILCFWRC